MKPPRSSQQITTIGHYHCAEVRRHETQESFSRTLAHPHLRTGSLQAEALAIIAELVILTFAVAVLVVGMLSWQPEIGDLAINFVAIILEAMPFMMVGAVIGGIIEAFVPSEFVQRALVGRTNATFLPRWPWGWSFPFANVQLFPFCST